MTAPVFTRTDEHLGTFSLRRVDPHTDAELLHRWVTHPKSAFWMMEEATLPEVEREFLEIAAHPRHDAFLGLHDGTPAFLAERYDPADDLGEAHEKQAGDIGMHFLCAPAGTPLHGFTRAVLITVMEFLFAQPAVRRVVVEPDVRNTAVHALNEAVGFRIEKTVPLPGKDAYLSLCTRDDFRAARGVRP
ncbi:hypothetical protein N566_02930 [Streptomycetaceae bacterium MP113-05]|nr:hypothetical protein N566_02930 [Streptomycetaceae bacterium MP113-05]